MSTLSTPSEISHSDISGITTKAPCEVALIGERHVRIEISDFVMRTFVLDCALFSPGSVGIFPVQTAIDHIDQDQLQDHPGRQRVHQLIAKGQNIKQCQPRHPHDREKSSQSALRSNSRSQTPAPATDYTCPFRSR